MMSSSTKLLTLKTCDSKTMIKVIEYWNKHSEEDKAFVKVHHSILYDVILAANFLNDKEILDVMCQEVKGKNQKKYVKNLISRMISLQKKRRRSVKRMLGLLNDFTKLLYFF